MSVELLDVIDFHRGEYTGEPAEVAATRVKPWKGWKLLDSVEMIRAAPPLPDALTAAQRDELASLRDDLIAAREDLALRRWRAFCRAHLSLTNGRWIADLGHRVMREAYLDGLDYEVALAELRAATAELERLRALDEADVSTLEGPRREVDARAEVLGELTHGPYRSLWDLKSMLKAMDELHAAQLRRLIAAG